MDKLEQAKQALIAADAAGDTQAATQLAQFIRQASAEQESGGLMQDLRRRGEQTAELYRQKQSGQITPFEEMYRSAGQVGNVIGDVAGAAISGAARNIDAMTGGYLGEQAQQGLQAVGRLPLPFTEQNLGQAAGQAVQNVGESYGRFKEAAPRAAGMLEATGSLATILPSFMSYADDIGKGVSKTAAAIKRPKILPSETVREQASALYKQADEIGGALNPQFADDYAKRVARASQKDPFITQIKRKAGKDDAYANVLEVMDEYRGQPLSFERAKALDETLGNLAYSNVDNFGKMDDVGRQYLEMQGTLREAIESAKPTDFMGGNQAFKIAKEARKQWTAQNKLRDIERIIENAERFDNPAKAIQTGFRTLLRSGKKIKGYSTSEIKAMEKAARTGIVTDALRIAGSSLGPIITGSVGVTTMGPAGMLAAVPAFAVQSGAKGLASARQTARAKNASREVVRSLQGMPSQSLSGALAQTAAPVAAASIPAGIASLTNEQMQYIMSLPPQEAQAILGSIKR